MKSQAGLEYLVLASFVTFILSIIFYYSLSYSSEMVSYNQAKDAVDTIAKAVDHVYALGPQSKTSVYVTIPSNVVNSSVSRNIVKLIISVAGRQNEIIAITKANITGNIPTKPGYYQVNISRINGEVKIG